MDDFYLLQENGDRLTLENGAGSYLLESLPIDIWIEQPPSSGLWVEQNAAAGLWIEQ